LGQPLGPFQAQAADQLSGLQAELIELLLEVRGTLRQQSQFALSDQIRDQLQELGITLKDGPEGTSWRVSG